MSTDKDDFQNEQDGFGGNMEDEYETSMDKETDDERASLDSSSQSEEAHRQLRDAMADDVAEFLSRGGKIQSIEPNVMADPPRKPQTSYGSRPI